MKQLLLGCGHSREKRMMLPGKPIGGWTELTTLDGNSDCKPDIVCDLNYPNYLYGWLPSKYNDYFDEVHAYEVLEHLGRQGDCSSFFHTFDNIYRILRPNGYLFATCPSRFSPWLWGDPGHCRAILPESLVFLDQTEYRQCGKTMMSDYRNIYKSDFKVISSTDDKQFHKFILQTIKPARSTLSGEGKQ